MKNCDMVRSWVNGAAVFLAGIHPQSVDGGPGIRVGKQGVVNAGANSEFVSQ